MVSMEHIIMNKNHFLLSSVRRNLKNILLVCGVFFLLGFLLMHPAESLVCAKAGMTLWLNTLIPTLLPFIILTGILTRIDNIQKILSPLESYFRVLLGVSSWGGYVFLLGMLCGYPLGAKLASDLYESDKISKKEAVYLSTFCNNPSPAFVITYLGKLCLKDVVPAYFILISLFSANLICMLFFRYAVYKNQILTSAQYTDTRNEKEVMSTVPAGNIVNTSIMNGFETITRLGGYILLFSILSGCIRYYQPVPAFYQNLLLGFTEITTGLSIISSSNLSVTARIFVSVSATASGGLCILAQTRSIFHCDLSLMPYIVSKCISAVLTSFILYCLLYYFL